MIWIFNDMVSSVGYLKWPSYEAQIVIAAEWEYERWQRELLFKLGRKSPGGCQGGPPFRVAAPKVRFDPRWKAGRVRRIAERKREERLKAKG